MDSVVLVGAVGCQEFDLALEVLGILEGLVDAGEANRRNCVESSELRQCEGADLCAFHGAAVWGQLVLDSADERLDRRFVDGATLAGGSDARFDLGPVERLTIPAALDDGGRHVLDALEGGEPSRARLTLPSTPDGGPVLRRPGVDDSILE
jgi:hypothetical protein